MTRKPHNYLTNKSFCVLLISFSGLAFAADTDELPALSGDAYSVQIDQTNPAYQIELQKKEQLLQQLNQNWWSKSTSLQRRLSVENIAKDNHEDEKSISSLKIEGSPFTTVSISYDSLLMMARSGQSEKAIPLAEQYLKEKNNREVNVLLGRMLIWNKRYAEAEKQFLIALNAKPGGYTDASVGLADLYIAEDNYSEALKAINEGLTHNSTSGELADRKKVVLEHLNSPQVATEAPTTPEEIKKPGITYEQLSHMAHSGQSLKAIPLAEEYLKTEENADVRVLLGFMLTWNHRYDEARSNFQQVLATHPNGYADASVGLANVEFWSDNNQQALKVVDDGLKHDPTDKDLLALRKRIVNSHLEKNTALLGIQGITENGAIVNSGFVSPGSTDHKLNAIGIDYEYTNVSDLDETWDFASLAYKRYFSFGPIIVRVNRAYRFQEYGTQYEIDAYPHLFSGAYLYLNYGYSNASFFPQSRYGSEAFFSLPKAFEFSIGDRILHFEGSSDTIVYTGSVGKYIGNYWISYRPYVTNSLVSYLTIRRYFSTADSYVSLALGYGAGPSNFNIQDPNSISQDRTRSVRLDGQYPLTKDLFLTWLVEYSLDHFPNAIGSNRTEIDLDMGLIWKF